MCFKNIWAMIWQNQQNECVPREDSDQLGIHPVWSESSLSASRKLGSLAPIESTAKTLIRMGGCPGWPVFAGHTQFVGSYAVSRSYDTIISVFDLVNIYPTIPKFWYKGILRVWCTNTCYMNVKLTLVLNCGFICCSERTKVLNVCF